MNAIDVPEMLPDPPGPKVQYFTATTLDGFIADADNSLDWLFAVERDEDDGSWHEFIDGVGALVMGATTYEWVLGHEPEMLESPDKWRGYYDDRPTWVFTHRELPAHPRHRPDVRAGRRPGGARRIVEAVPGKNLWLVGGGDLVGQFDDAGLLDEIRLGLTPVTLGSGAPLLPRRITSERLRLRSVDRSGQLVQLVYEVSRRAVELILGHPAGDLGRGRAGREHLADAQLLEDGDVLLGDDPAAEDGDVRGVALGQEVDEGAEERHVRPGEDREADQVGVLLDRGLHDLLGRLVEAGVDDLVPGVAERAGHDLGAAVVTVEAGLADHDAQPAGAGGCGRGHERRLPGRVRLWGDLTTSSAYT